MSHCGESCISRFLLLRGSVGCKGNLCGGVYRVCGSLESQTRLQEPYGYGRVFSKNFLDLQKNNLELQARLPVSNCFLCQHYKSVTCQIPESGHTY
jgi:hypothetical protein